MPLAVAGQVAPDRAPRVDSGDRQYRNMVFAGFGYTSLNQVNQSRHGLVGANFEVTRDWGRFFALTADGAFYNWSAGSQNPGKPSVDLVLFGPELHGKLFEGWSVFARALIGGAHTGGESMTPNISFAGGGGVGVEHNLKQRIVIRAFGDSIASSFSVTGNSTQLGYSPHVRRNARAAVGIGYRF